MVKKCQWGLCKSDSRYPDRLNGAIFIPFVLPKHNLQKCKRWIEACGRPHYQLNVDNVNKHRYICSKHFQEIINRRPSEQFPDPLPAVTFATKYKYGETHYPRPRTYLRTKRLQPIQTLNSDAECASLNENQSALEPTKIHTEPIEIDRIQVVQNAVEGGSLLNSTSMNPVWAILYGSKQKSFITRTQSPSSDSLKTEQDCASDASKTNFFVTKIENLPLELSNADLHVEMDRIDSNVKKKENCFFEDGSTDSNVPFVDLKLELELESVKVETFDDTLSSLNVQPKSEENKLLDSSLIKSERSSDCHTQIRVFPTNNSNEKEELNVKTEESFLRNHKSGDAIIEDCFVELEKLVDGFHSNQLSQTKADMTSESCSDFQKSSRVSMVMPEKTRLQQCHSHTSGQMVTASTSTSTSVETIQSSGMDHISNGQDKHFQHPIDLELEAGTDCWTVLQQCRYSTETTL